MPLINDAGKLNQRCTFYSMQEIETRRGTTKTVKQEEFSCWCTVRQARISEIQAAIGTEHINKQTLIVRRQQKKEIQNDWTVKVRGQEFDIVSIVPDYETQKHDMIVLREKH